MADVTTPLAASQKAIEELLVLTDARVTRWTTPRAPGKWSPSQLVEHLARSFEESARMATGQPAKFPNLPFFIRPLVRGLLFKRVLRTGRFPKARTNKAMDPAAGPATPAEGRARLVAAHAEFETACRQTASGNGLLRTTTFGAVPVDDYIRFMEIHTRHHAAQLAE
jgi:hypothetical protein